MKLDAIRFCSAAILIFAASAATSAMSAEEGSKTTTCIREVEIDNTVSPDTPDDRTIIFHMRNGDLYRNDLVNNCPGLRLLGGYTFSPTNPGTREICSNLQSITLRSNGQICILGNFTRIPAKPRS